MLMEQKSKRIVGGVLIKCTETDRVLLLLRNDKGEDPNLWSMVTGGIDEGESILEGLKREVNEEMSIDPNIINYKFIEKIYISEKNMDFHYFQGFTKSEFLPKLDHENLDFKWCDKDDLPSPLYPGIIDKINVI